MQLTSVRKVTPIILAGLILGIIARVTDGLAWTVMLLVSSAGVVAIAQQTLP